MSIVIDEVTLENFKSYSGETTIELGTGVTAILGDNGAGKSTIQEGVGFALFDTHPFQNQDRLVRDGESSGHVEVTFTNQTTGDTYTVRRWAGRSKYDVLDENGDLLGLDTKSDVKGWICTELGIDSPNELAEIWERSIGVPQTDFLSDFTQTEADRIDTFDPLFDIERYREAYKSLSGLEDEFEDGIDELEKEIIQLEVKLEDLPNVEEKVESYEQTITELTQEIQSLEDEIEKLEGEKSELESRKEELRNAEQDLKALEETKIPAQQKSLESAEERRDEAEKAKKILEEVEDDYQRHKTAKLRLEELEDDREERDRLKNRFSDVGSEIDLLKERVSGYKADLMEARQAEEQVEDLEPKKEQYESLKNEISELEDKEGRINDVETRIDEIDDKIVDLKEEIKEVEAKIEEAESQQEEADRLSELQEENQEFFVQKQTLENEIDDLQEQNAELRDIDLDGNTEISCPTCDRPITADHREKVISQNEARINEVTNQEIPELKTEISELKEEIELARAAKEAVNQIPNLESELEDLEESIAEFRDKKQELKQERRELEDKVAEIPKKREELEELEGVVDKYHTAKAKVDSAEDAPEILRTTRNELGKKLIIYQEIRESLSKFDGLDEEIDQAKQTINETEEAHQRYVKNEDEVAKLSERQQEVTDELAELADLKAKREDVETCIEDLRAEFDPGYLNEVIDKLDDLKQNRAQREQQHKNAKSNLGEAQERLAELEEKLKEKRELEQEVVEVERDQRFAHWARNSLQQGAEDLRDLITSEIGDRANTIFQQLRGNPTETLVWDKTYNLRVHVRAQNKPYDTLSGGEKMAAALSVRLAILERLASVGIAFLDEPTANLDQEKKQNLVNQLDDLNQLNQLLAVSHDRTFESLTERTIELEKDEHEELTRVVSD
ncbi:AAA family ATPase [Halomicrococcus sp. NG-SE-24]|uniref:AAA family ATPase n=1 Tax=Halomicrococcus sp. NG-SE-24 TaxID=3436928 RepID=UPI003D97FC65